MAFVPVPDMALATINYLSDDGTFAVNRLFCGSTDPISAADLEEITEALYDLWVAQIMPTVTASWALIGITARAMNIAEGLEHEDTNSYPIEGSQDSAFASPLQVAYTVTLNTGLVGRSARGRVYGLGLGSDYLNDTTLTEIGQASLQSAWELVRLGMITAGHAINVVSFTEGGVPRAAGRPLPVLSLNVRFPLATQRRRLS